MTPSAPAYLDRRGDAWIVIRDRLVSLGSGESFQKDEVERMCGPLVPLWPEGKAPQPDAYVWTQGDDEDDLLARLVKGVHVTMERGGVTYSGGLTRDEGWTRLGESGPYLFRPGGLSCSAVEEADRITVVPPPEPVLPGWVTYRGEGQLRMIAATSDGQAWWPSAPDQWVRRDGVERITDAELIAQGGRLLIDHTGRVVQP